LESNKDQKFLGRWEIKKEPNLNYSKQINWAIKTTTGKLNYYYNYSKQLTIKTSNQFQHHPSNGAKNLFVF